MLLRSSLLIALLFILSGCQIIDSLTTIKDVNGQDVDAYALYTRTYSRVDPALVVVECPKSGCNFTRLVVNNPRAYDALQQRKPSDWGRVAESAVRWMGGPWVLGGYVLDRFTQPNNTNYKAGGDLVVGDNANFNNPIPTDYHVGENLIQGDNPAFDNPVTTHTSSSTSSSDTISTETETTTSNNRY